MIISKKVVIVFIVLLIFVVLNQIIGALMNKVEGFANSVITPLVFDSVTITTVGTPVQRSVFQPGNYTFIIGGAASGSYRTQYGKGEVVIYENVPLKEHDVIIINNGKIGTVNYTGGKHRVLDTITSGTPTTVSINNNITMTANPGSGCKNCQDLMNKNKPYVSDAQITSNHYNSSDLKNFGINAGNTPGFNTGNGFVVIYPSNMGVGATTTPTTAPTTCRTR
jgi:hypothetical protein